MLQYTPASYPSWYVEGFAEIASTASFEREGAITFGKVAQHRQLELDYGGSVPVVAMIDGSYLRNRRHGWSYGDAWLLTHYLTFSDQRRGQLRAYLHAINSGRSMAEAATVFGDLSEMQRNVSSYLAGRTFSYRAVPLSTAAVEVSPVRMLSEAEGALIDEQIELADKTTLPKKEFDSEEAAARNDFDARLARATEERQRWLTALEAKVNRFANDPFAWRLLADAQCRSENFQACLNAAQRSLAIAPEDRRSTLRRAQAQLELASALPEAERATAINAARAEIALIMSANHNDPLPLQLYFRSYAAEGIAPPDEAIIMLLSAVQLIPQLSEPRLALARALIERERFDEARAILRPLAFAPHNSGAAMQARALLEAIDATLNGEAEPEPSET